MTACLLRVGISGLSAALSLYRYFHTVHSFFHFRYFLCPIRVRPWARHKSARKYKGGLLLLDKF
jgi:hypothetical protein